MILQEISDTAIRQQVHLSSEKGNIVAKAKQRMKMKTKASKGAAVPREKKESAPHTEHGKVNCAEIYQHLEIGVGYCSKEEQERPSEETSGT